MRLNHHGLFSVPGTIISLCVYFYYTKGRHGFSAPAAPPVSACFLLALLNAITDQITFKVIGEHKGVWGSKFLNEIGYSCMSLYALRKVPLFSGACFFLQPSTIRGLNLTLFLWGIISLQRHLWFH